MVNEIKTPTEIYALRASLAQRIQQDAEVKDPMNGFVLCKGVNRLVRPDILGDAAKIATFGFLNKLPPEFKPDKVVGVQSHGAAFQTAIGLTANLLMPHSERRDHNGAAKITEVKYDERNKIAVVRGIPSVSKPGLHFDHYIYEVEPGEVIVVADDFSATGAATDAYRQLEQFGLRLVFVYIVAKDFPLLFPPQTEYRRMKERGVPVFATTIFTSINDHTVVATADDI